MEYRICQSRRGSINISCRKSLGLKKNIPGVVEGLRKGTAIIRIVYGVHVRYTRPQAPLFENGAAKIESERDENSSLANTSPKKTKNPAWEGQPDSSLRGRASIA